MKPKQEAREAQITTATDGDFESTIRQDNLVLVAFVRPWSGPCHLLTHALSELAPAYEGRVHVASLDVDDNPTASKQMGVTEIPSLIFFRDGKVLDRIGGSAPRAAIIRMIERLLSDDAGHSDAQSKGGER